VANAKGKKTYSLDDLNIEKTKMKLHKEEDNKQRQERSIRIYRIQKEISKGREIIEEMQKSQREGSSNKSCR